MGGGEAFHTHIYTHTYIIPPIFFLTAANQKEPMNLNFKVKEEPKEEEALSTALPRPSYVFNPEPEVAAQSISEDTLKSQEGKGNVLRRDMSVKAASELLMKLSGTRFILKHSHSDPFSSNPTGPLPAWFIINLMVTVSHYCSEFENDQTTWLKFLCCACMCVFISISPLPILLHAALFFCKWSETTASFQDDVGHHF